MNYINTRYLSYNNYISTYYKLKKIKKHRQQLKQIKNINDTIKFFKGFCKNNNCADNILDKIYILYLYEPPTEIEIQLLSILQQISAMRMKNEIKVTKRVILWVAMTLIVVAKGVLN